MSLFRRIRPAVKSLLSCAGRVLLCLTVCSLFWTAAAQASEQAEEFWEFDTVEQRQLFDELLQELACPSCLGSSLAESPAPIAEDMRREVWRQIRRGRSGEQIRQWMIERYGSSVSTRPQGWVAAVLLWLLPVLLGLLALLLLRRATGSGDGGQVEERPRD